MALVFNAIEPVRFGNLEAIPKVGAELRLRIQKIDFGNTDEKISAARDVLSQAFGDKSMEVRKFMSDNDMSAFDLERLAAYLIGGDNLLAQFDEIIKSNGAKLAEKGVEDVKTD